jgi:hypothetical protein
VFASGKATLLSTPASFIFSSTPSHIVPEPT